MTASSSDRQLIAQWQTAGDPPRTRMIKRGSNLRSLDAQAITHEQPPTSQALTKLSGLHVSCTVAQDEASSVQLRQDPSHGSLVCVECGMRFENIKSLQTHVENKITWTNRSLLGSRVSVMWAHNQWFEGTVTQYDTVYGRHCVVYDDGEKKWYHMANKTFYVISHAEDDTASPVRSKENRLTSEKTAKTHRHMAGLTQLL